MKALAILLIFTTFASPLHAALNISIRAESRDSQNRCAICHDGGDDLVTCSNPDGTTFHGECARLYNQGHCPGCNFRVPEVIAPESIDKMADEDLLQIEASKAMQLQRPFDEFWGDVLNLEKFSYLTTQERFEVIGRFFIERQAYGHLQLLLTQQEMVKDPSWVVFFGFLLKAQGSEKAVELLNHPNVKKYAPWSSVLSQVLRRDFGERFFRAVKSSDMVRTQIIFSPTVVLWPFVIWAVNTHMHHDKVGGIAMLGLFLGTLNSLASLVFLVSSAHYVSDFVSRGIPILKDESICQSIIALFWQKEVQENPDSLRALAKLFRVRLPKALRIQREQARDQMMRQLNELDMSRLNTHQKFEWLTAVLETGAVLRLHAVASKKFLSDPDIQNSPDFDRWVKAFAKLTKKIKINKKSLGKNTCEQKLKPPSQKGVQEK